ncbi:MAG: hypothetical protein DRQ78_07165 [Epsilonproteobacteria bacterium]|nr:MAG: hypothetical protein DRQ78_07165 [Campylobacterota bacterium]
MSVTLVQNKSKRARLEYKECKVCNLIDVSVDNMASLIFYDTIVFFKEPISFTGINTLESDQLVIEAHEDFNLFDSGMFDYDPLLLIEQTNINKFEVLLNNLVSDDVEGGYIGIAFDNVNAKDINITYSAFVPPPVEFEISLNIVDLGSGGGYEPMTFELIIETMGTSDVLIGTGTVNIGEGNIDCSPSSYNITEAGAYLFTTPAEIGCHEIEFGVQAIDNTSGVRKTAEQTDYPCY